MHLFKGFTKSVSQPSPPKSGLKNSSQVCGVERSWLDSACECPSYHCPRPSAFFLVPFPSLSSLKAQTKFLSDSWQVGWCLLSFHEELTSVVDGNGFFRVVSLIGLSGGSLLSLPPPSHGMLRVLFLFLHWLFLIILFGSSHYCAGSCSWTFFYAALPPLQCHPPRWPSLPALGLILRPAWKPQDSPCSV